MKKIITIIIIILSSTFALSQNAIQKLHPNLIINKNDVEVMRSALGKYPLFDKAFEDAKYIVDKALSLPMDVPVPNDAGGYTHERHKKNYTEMQLAGILYQVTNEERYARFIKDMLLTYAELLPGLPIHPMTKGESHGRLFWQSLNETVWLVHTTQAYDCIYEWLSPSDRKLIEEKVIRYMAEYLVREHHEELDRIHNHGTWTAAAVGMAGYVLDDKDLQDKALYSSKKDKTGGFIRQLDLLFSPDGYYTEGLYYVRYALMPFFYFAQVIENNQPELKIFNYRNQIFKKAFYSAMQLTNTDGAFMPINDALKEKDFRSPEIVVALDITYKLFGQDPSLLSIAREQNSVMLSAAGVQVAKGLATFVAIPEFKRTSVEYTDGGDGNEGGIGVLRYGPLDDQAFLVMKYTAHGLSHGHFDKLNLIFYDQGKEILQDYGAARFINVEPKFGGRYLSETKSFTMQTIAHNTITIDEKSHYQGKISIAEQYHPVRHFYSITDSDCQVMSANASNVYKGVEMQRTMAMVKDDRFNKPVIIDVFKIDTKDKHQYDLPFYYMGHLIYTNVKYKAHDKERTPLGKTNGYQHLWKEAEGKAEGSVKFSWLQGNRYYSLVSSADTSTQVFFTRIGANDPNFNLRNEPGIIIRQNVGSHVFASVIEPHGSWDGVKEFSKDATGRIHTVKVLTANDEGTVVNIIGNDNLNWLLMLANKDASESAKHKIKVNDKVYEWTGPFKLIK